MLAILIIGVLILVAGLHWREGVFNAGIVFCNVLAAGLLAFNSFEPLARWLGERGGAALDQYADALSLIFLFSLCLGMLRLFTSFVAPREPTLPASVRRFGSLAFGLLTGYAISGILSCTLQTLPWHERFLGYEPQDEIGLGTPDRFWLAFVHRATGKVFDHLDENWFDADGSYVERYARFRRVREGHADPLPHRGEFPAVLDSKKPATDTP